MFFRRICRHRSSRIIAASSLFFLAACSETPTAADALPGSPAAATAVPADAVPAQSFEQWQAAFRTHALQSGIRTDVFDNAFKGVMPDPSVIEADRSQPEFSRPVWQYLDSAISPVRVRKGQALLNQYGADLQRIEQRFGVDRQALVAVWGMESSFGQFQGDKSVIRSLSTLGYEGRRPGFAQEQLVAALQILQNGDIDAAHMLGSWAGAMGQTQFIPTTYNAHAVDFDGDGRRDIWNSAVDALASTAQYLQASGWQRGQPWGMEVQLPAGFDYAQADGSLRKPVSEWLAQGVKLPPGAVVAPAVAQQQANLLLPAGYRGPAFLVLDNFRAILKYNNSSSYALGVSLLSQRFSGGGYVQGAWPTDDLPLSRTERIELQTLLSAAQYDAGAPDGIIGSNTRKAIRAAQQARGWPADGYPTHKLLESLRQGQ
ncbi:MULTISPECIES: lytic murein transglycosylase [Pseudomonas]|uniref:Lytic murein transglycosylase n=1 Tax=Pseudomonas quercus TaxID=2722792 RepID=A0ABX0YGH3_9PSED|nr:MULTISPECIES: lytic murein transglycosylase [Pseudomonas]MBF7143980.1 lytic murein transglycosylase [Pseudomonas sp. LY10J]NJP02520.1 lytic murein transglycosylase [Pseudomonas quercus]